MSDYSIGQCMLNIRKQEGLSRHVFAGKYGLSVNLVMSIETDKHQVTNRTVRKLMTIFGDNVFESFIVVNKCKECGIEFIPDTRELFCCPEHGLLYNRSSIRVRERAVTKERSERRGWNKRSKLTPLANDLHEARSLGLSYGKWRACKMGWI